MNTFALDVKNTVPFVIPATTADAANVGVPQAVELPGAGLYLVDVTMPVFLRDESAKGGAMRVGGAGNVVPTEFLLRPGDTQRAPLKLSQFVLLASEGGVEACVRFVPLIRVCA